MTRTLIALFTLAASPAFGQDPDHDKKDAGKGEIRVYVADKDKKTVDPKDLSVTVVLEPKGAPKRTLKTELVAPKGDAKAGIGHGGEVLEAEPYHVEMVVVKPHAHGKEEGKGHDDDKAVDATPYFKAATDLTAYSCGMAGHPTLDKPGKCTQCPMTAKPINLEFSAVVIFKVGSETKNVRGFQYPPAVPKDFSGALAKIEEHLKAIDGLIAANDLDKVHSSAEKISHVAEGLPALAPKDDKAEVEKVAKEIVALFKEIDDAADAGKKAETVTVVGKYRSKVAELKKHAKGDHDHK